MISVSLNEVFKNSMKYAKENSHEYLTIEHIFWSILQSDEGRYTLQTLDIDPDKLTEEIVEYIESNIPSTDENIEPFETMALSKAINDMMIQIHSSGRKEASIGDMLASIFLQENSYALYLMRKEGIHSFLCRIPSLFIFFNSTNNRINCLPSFACCF